MKQYIFAIHSPNRVFEIQGKQVRTPCEFAVDECEIELYELKVKSDGDTQYSIRERDAKTFTVVARDRVEVKEKKQVQNDVNVKKSKKNTSAIDKACCP